MALAVGAGALRAASRQTALLGKRMLAQAAAAPAAPATIKFTEPKVSTLPSGITVVTEDSGSPVSTLTIAVKAGSRYETVNEIGTAAALGAMAFQGTTNRTALAIARETAAAGVTLSATAWRDYISYTATFLRDELPVAVNNLADAISGQLINTWEFAEAKERLALAYGSRCPIQAVIDDAHTVAFRRTLGQAPICPPCASSVLTAESLRAYIAETFLAGRVTVAASGASHAAVAALVGKTFGLAAAQGRAPAPAKYFGGEHRTAIYGDRTYMAVALPGAPAGAAPVATVFRYVLGSAVAVKWGAGASQLQAQVRAAAGGANVRLDTFGLSYADAGLLGVTAATDAASATAVGAAMVAVVKGVVTGTITEADVARAKAMARTSVLDQGRAARAARLAALGSRAISNEARADQIAAVTLADVKSFAAKLATAKPSFAVRGRLADAPYFDELL